MSVAWNISSTPDAALVNIMLDQAIHCLLPNEHPVVHSVGCSLDNFACERFLVRIKNGMFYGCSCQGVTLENLCMKLKSICYGTGTNT